LCVAPKTREKLHDKAVLQTGRIWMTQSHVVLGLFCTLKRQEEFRMFAHSQFSAGLQDKIVLQMREIRATCPANLDQSQIPELLKLGVMGVNRDVTNDQSMTSSELVISIYNNFCNDFDIYPIPQR
jgi:hypothetical protein